MPKQDLHSTLEALQAELAKMDRVDPETRAKLKRVTDQIERRLEDRANEHRDESLTGQLHDFMLSIETDHPRLTRAVNQVADALANLGI